MGMFRRNSVEPTPGGLANGGQATGARSAHPPGRADRPHGPPRMHGPPRPAGRGVGPATRRPAPGTRHPAGRRTGSGHGAPISPPGSSGPWRAARRGRHAAGPSRNARDPRTGGRGTGGPSSSRPRRRTCSTSVCRTGHHTAAARPSPRDDLPDPAVQPGRWSRGVRQRPTEERVDGESAESPRRTLAPPRHRVHGPGRDGTDGAANPGPATDR